MSSAVHYMYHCGSLSCNNKFHVRVKGRKMDIRDFNDPQQVVFLVVQKLNQYLSTHN
jgi:hypothetical protein